MRAVHPLAQMITDDFIGNHRPVDGGWTWTPPWNERVEGIVAFTGHAVFAVGVGVRDGDLAGLEVDGYGGAHHPHVVTKLAGPGGWIDSLDLVLVRRGTDATSKLVKRVDLIDHPRARLARTLRNDVAVFGLSDRARTAVVCLGAGIGELLELSFEMEPDRRGHGEAASLVLDAIDLVPKNRIVLASVAPGNVASARVLLACDFKPVASIQLFRRRSRSPVS